MYLRTTFSRVLVCTIAAAFLSGCGQEQDTVEETVSHGQVVAKVNGREITIHELNSELSQMNASIDPAEIEQVKQKALRRIVERTLLEQRAIEQDLHRQPDVMLQLRQARSEVLSRNAVRNAMAQHARAVTPEEIQAFITEQPSLFADRQFFEFSQIIIDRTDQTDALLDEIDEFGSLDDAAALFEQSGITFRKQPSSGHSTQFPAQMVTALNGLEIGEIFAVKSKDKTYVTQLLERRADPLIGQDAAEAAQQYLARQQTMEITNDLAREVTSSANVEFYGDFSEMTFGPDTLMEAPEPADSPETGAQTPEPAEAPSQDQNPDEQTDPAP